MIGIEKVTLENVGKHSFKVTIREHEFYIDLSKEKGGEDKGPNPPELLLASIGGCIGIVTKLIAYMEKVKIEELRIEVEGEHDTRGSSNLTSTIPG